MMVGFLDKCCDIDGWFNLIDIFDIGCKYDVEDEVYCMDVKKVVDCLCIVKQICVIVIDEVFVY